PALRCFTKNPGWCLWLSKCTYGARPNAGRAGRPSHWDGKRKIVELEPGTRSRNTVLNVHIWWIRVASFMNVMYTPFAVSLRKARRDGAMLGVLEPAGRFANRVRRKFGRQKTLKDVIRRSSGGGKSKFRNRFGPSRRVVGVQATGR